MAEKPDPLERSFLNVWRSLVGEKVSCVVGFSGGADSTALLLLLSRLRSFFSSFSVVAFHLNHGFRETASRDEVFCREVCQKLGIPFVVEHADVSSYARECNLSLEEAGRLRRREGLERVREAHNLDWICLAHHQDDQVELFLLRLFQGTGIESAGGMRMKEGYYLRPLLGFSHRDMVDYLVRLGHSWCEDESNATLRFDRNWIRHNLLPVIEKRFPAAREKISSFMGFLQEIHASFEVYEKPLLDEVRFFPWGWRLPKSCLERYGVFWVRHVVKKLWYREGMIFVRGSWLESIDVYPSSETKELLEVKGKKLILDGTWLTWVRLEELPKILYAEIQPKKEVTVGPWSFEWLVWEKPGDGFPLATEERVFLPMRVTSLQIRHVLPGDRIRLKHGHKKIHDLWVDEHLPWLERQFAFVLEENGALVAVYLPSRGFRVSYDYYIDKRENQPCQGIVVTPFVKL
ncbi:tRNA lysidine(34) synthetase TilS [Thermospira aquatica]|uniref:tRNA(Ile)-lysidine synthase n=1 Tax=Thermospira aquatica TaxID=2828656 RepID=A0AAX3BDD9_9SPIR|nr:tRNA lysidine(34) synthetase TilS [Thermospira aquatica]URA10211.1 tRNA lysidine(34) synthetase TilS [Thermospira aquatica]